MSADTLPPGLVSHGLALGLSYHDAATAEPLAASLQAVIERVGGREISWPMMAKTTGAALRYDRRLGRIMTGAAGGTLRVTVLITAAGGGAALPDRSIIPRRIVVPLRLDDSGLPRAIGSAPEGKWLFALRMHSGATRRLEPGATAIRGRITWPGAAGAPLRWGHVIARTGNGTLAGTARTDDRGEFVLRLRGRPGQSPNLLVPVPVTLTLHAPAALPALPQHPWGDVVAEDLAQPDTAADLPPTGMVARAGPAATLIPGRVLTLPPIVLP